MVSLRWLVVLMGCLWLAACRLGWVSYSYAALGLTLELPADWVVTVDYQDDLSSALSVKPAGGGAAAVQIFLTTRAQVADLGLAEPADYLQFFLDTLAGDTYEVTTPVTAIDFQGRPAATATLRHGADLTATATAWEDEEGLYITTLVFDSSGQEEATMTRIVESIRWLEE